MRGPPTCRYGIFMLNADVGQLMSIECELDRMDDDGPTELDLEHIAPDDEFLAELSERLDVDSPASTAAPSITHTPKDASAVLPHSPSPTARELDLSKEATEPLSLGACKRALGREHKRSVTHD
jgi:hypothetical protein